MDAAMAIAGSSDCHAADRSTYFSPGSPSWKTHGGLCRPFMGRGRCQPMQEAYGTFAAPVGRNPLRRLRDVFQDSAEPLTLEGSRKSVDRAWGHLAIHEGHWVAERPCCKQAEKEAGVRSGGAGWPA